MKKLLIVMVLGASAVAATAQGQETCSARQKGAAVVTAKSGDCGYVPGLQQGVFRNGRYNVNFSATCAEADSFSHTLGTILADVNQTRTSCQIRNDLTGTLERWPSWAAILYEGEMYFEGGQEYNFFGCVDDLAACELDGKCFWCVGLQQINNLGVQVYSKKFEESGWHPIRVWLMDIGWDRGAVARRVGFQGMGIGWNTNGCKVVNATTCLQWNRLLDDGSGRLLRSRVLPQKGARQSENGPMGTKEGDVHTFGVRDGLPFEVEMVWVDGCRDVDGFWVGKNRVTHRQWKCIMGYDPVDKNMQGEDSPIGLACMGWGGDYLFLWGLNARYSGAGRFDRLSDAQWQLAAKYASVDLPTEAASLRLAFRPTDRRNRERECQKQIKGESDAAFEAKLANGEGRRYSLAKGLDLDVIRVEGYGETFYLGRYEVTVEQYEKVMTSNPSIWSGAANLPVGSVDWTNATVFCEKLNALVPVEGMVWALPTSKQWAFVANGGLKKQANTFFGGNNWQEVGWWGGDEFGHKYVRPVGLKKPNELGFHDLFGNCWEWCSDGDGRKDFRYLGGPGVGYAGGRRLVESFYSGRMKDAAKDWGLRVALVKPSERLKRLGLLGGSFRARRLQRQQAAQAAFANTNEVTVPYQVLDGTVVLGVGGLLRPRNERKTVVLKIESGALEIPDKVEGMIVRGIGRGAFTRCSGLNSLMIPASVTNIANIAFSGRGGFTSILVDAANPLYSSRSGMLCSKDGTILIAGVNGDVKIPSCVTTIGENSFYGYSGLKSVTIPKGVVRIGRGAFRGCNGLESVTISSSVTSIGENAFDCSSGELRSFSVDPDNPLFCSRNGMLCNKDGTTLISGVSGDVTIPEGVTSIHDHAFSGRSGLRSLKLPSTVTNIGVNAFLCCSGLKSVFIPKGVVCIRSHAFGGCSGLESVAISSSVKSIADDVFGGLGTLAPFRQRSLGCNSIRSFSVDSDNPSYSSRNGLLCTKDGSTLIAGVNGDVAIPEGVTCIGRCAFSCREGLLSVEMPQSVKQIGESAFGGCSMLEAVTIPCSVTNIGSLAFARCEKLKVVDVVKDGRVESVAFDDFAKQHKLLTDERAVQRRQLQMIQNELKRLREEKDVAQKKEIFASQNCTSDKPAQGKIVVADKLQSSDFLLNKDFKKNAKFYLCLFSASWCGPCRREMPRIAKAYAETLKDDPDIELIHFSRDQNDEKALAWAKEHDVKFPVVKPNGGNPLDLHSRGIPHLFIVKADGTLVEEGHPMRIFNEEKFRELKGGSIENATANGEEEGSKEHVPNESFVLTGPYGIRMTGRADCKKDAEYVLKKLVDVYLPCAVRYYGDPFGGKTPSRVFTIDVQRKDGSGKGGRAGHPWGYQDGKFNIGLVKDGDRWDLAKDYYLIMAFRILTVCEEADWAGLTLYAGDFVWGDIDHDDPIPRIKEDIRKGFELARTGEKVTGLLWATRRYAPMWAALEELREKHPTLVLDYCNLKNSKYAKGELPQKISADQMVALLGEVTGVDAAAIFKKHSAAVVPSTPQGKIAVAEKLGQCDFLLNKDFKKNAKFYLCLFSASWCGPCRAEMPRIAKTYAEILKDDPDIELIHFSRDQNDEKALAWAKEHDVKFPVVKPNGGNPLDLHSRGIPHLFIVKADGTVLEEGHPMRIFNEEKFQELNGLKLACDMKTQVNKCGDRANGCAEKIDGYTWSYRVNDGDATIMKLERCHESCAVSPAPKGYVTVPATLGGAKVTGIGGSAFVFCHEMTSVTLPDTVKEIGSSAFLGCSGLTTMTIPEGVTNIGRQAFAGCEKLKSIMIPASVTSIGGGVFEWCRKLSEIKLAEGNQRFAVVDGVLYTKDLSELIMCPNTLTSVKIPSDVRNIGVSSFEGCEGLDSVTIPEGVTNIGWAAFRFCRKFKSVTIPASMVSIGEGSFTSCGALKEILVEPGNRNFTSVDGVLYTKDRAELVMCPNALTSAVILPEVKTVRPYAFSGCAGMTSITIPNGVTNIRHGAFSDCSGLKSVVVPSSVAKLGQQAFSRCAELENVTFLGERPDSIKNDFGGCAKLTAIHVPANAKSWAGMKAWQGKPLVFDAESKK